jgi:uncharacterized membrane protein YkvA (DUF1232 family)
MAATARENVKEIAGDLWGKLRASAAHIPFAADALAIYYCALDRATPIRVRLAIFGALAYFIAPVDSMPDFMPLLGFTDDAAILAATLQLVASHILPEHRAAAERALSNLATTQS